MPKEMKSLSQKIVHLVVRLHNRYMGGTHFFLSPIGQKIWLFNLISVVHHTIRRLRGFEALLVFEKPRRICNGKKKTFLFAFYWAPKVLFFQ